VTPPPSRPPVRDLIDRLAAELAAQRDPRAVLDRSVQLAQDAFPAADSISVSVVDKRHRPLTISASDGLARTGDDLQYRLGEGPCLDALWTADVVHSPDLDSEPRWSAWSRRAAAELDVHSMLSLRLATRDRTAGSINLYGRRRDAFDPDTIALGRSFAVHAAVAHGHAVDRQNLEAALVSRNLVGQAQGILMERHRITADRAFEVLVTASQERNVKLIEVARRVVETGAEPHAR
jgi:transcriptional regulator with GAF, ATPase, and Fis domain